MRWLLVLIVLLVSGSFYCQQKPNVNALFTIRGQVGIPKGVGSQMFSTSFKGIYEANISANYRLFANVTAGLGYHNNQFINNKRIFVQYTVPANQKTGGGALTYETRMVTQGGFVRLGYDKFFSDIGFASFALNSGIMSGVFKKVIPDTSAANKPLVAPSFNAPYVQPEISINFITEKLLSFSIFMSYTTVFYKFDPKAPRFNHINEVRDSRNNYPMNWINIGFGFAVLIDTKK